MDVVITRNQPVEIVRDVQSLTVVKQTPQAVVTETSNSVDVVETRTRTVEIDVPGLPGPPGPPGTGGGAGGTVAPIPFYFGDARRAVFAAPSDGLLSYARLSIDTAFDGAPSRIKVGTQSAAEAVLPASYNDPAAVGDYETNPDVQLAAGEQVFLAITPGVGVTQGQGFLLLAFIPD